MNRAIALQWAVPYTLVGIARDAVYVFVLSFYFIYLNQAEGIPLAVMMPFFLGIKFIDFIKEPFLGILIDQLADRYRYNKFRFTILAGGLLNSFIVLQMFNLPYMSQGSQIFYAALMLILWSLTFSLIDLPSWALTSMFGSDNRTREIMSSIARFSAIAGFCVTFYASYVIFVPPDDMPANIARNLKAESFQLVSWIVAGITATVSVIFALTFRIQEPARRVASVDEALDNFFGNDQLMIIFFITMMQQICMSIFVGYQGFFTLTLGDIPSDAQILRHINIPWIISLLLSFVLFYPLARITSRRAVFIGSLVILILCAGALFTTYMAKVLSLNMLTVFMSIIGMCFGLSLVSTTVMTADCVDYGEFKFGKRSECMSFSVQVLSSKLGSLVAFIFASEGSAYAKVYATSNVQFKNLYSINIGMLVVILCAVLMIVVYVNYYKLHGSFFENILNAINSFGKNDKSFNKSKSNSVRYALDEHCVMHNLKASSLDDIIDILTDRLYAVKAITSRQVFKKELRRKIEINPAGIANGIAIPHARGSFVTRSSMAVATLAEPIDCGSFDNRPCDLIFLIAVPDNGRAHMNLLGNLSLVLSEPGFADRLRHAGSSEDITKRLILCEKKLFK